MIDQELKNALSDVMAGLPPEKLTFAFDPRLKEALSHVQKPGRYTGGEPGSVYKEKEKMDVRFAFCFPDTYEVGMSFLGEKILYELLNQHENWWCERAFMPWLDMKAEMERLGLPLYALESKDPLTTFDAVGFTLQYELSYTNILAMLDLAGIPLYAADRDERWPLIVAGGPCTCNAEPLAAFFDVIQLGEGERQLPSICAAIEQGKKEGISKQELLLRLARIPGVYIPAFYDVSYEEDGRVRAITPNQPGVPAVVTKAIIQNMNDFAPPTKLCGAHGGAPSRIGPASRCCGAVCGAAGSARQASSTVPCASGTPGLLDKAARDLCANTGYEELSLSSLSTSDHSQLEELLDDLNSWAPQEHVSLSLPSLRMDNFSESLIEKTTRVRKSGLTFAAEAGTQRLRDVINKNVTWDEIEKTCRIAFEAGLHLGQAVLHDGSAHRDHGRHRGDRRDGPEGGGPVLPHPEPRQGQGGAGDGQLRLLCAQAPHALPVRAHGHRRDAGGQAEAPAGERPQPQDQGQLPRQQDQLPGRGVRQGGPPAGPRPSGSLPPRLLL